MTDFEVYWNDGYNLYKSKVYCIDTIQDRFLVVNFRDRFVWVKIDECELVVEED